LCIWRAHVLLRAMVSTGVSCLACWGEDRVEESDMAQQSPISIARKHVSVVYWALARVPEHTDVSDVLHTRTLTQAPKRFRLTLTHSSSQTTIAFLLDHTRDRASRRLSNPSHHHRVRRTHPAHAHGHTRLCSCRLLRQVFLSDCPFPYFACIHHGHSSCQYSARVGKNFIELSEKVSNLFSNVQRY
jgi:hypothetical protein